MKVFKYISVIILIALLAVFSRGDAYAVNSAPSAPGGTTNLGMNVTDRPPTVSWTASTDADGDTIYYYVYVGSTVAPSGAPSATVKTKPMAGDFTSGP